MRLDTLSAVMLVSFVGYYFGGAVETFVTFPVDYASPGREVEASRLTSSAQEASEDDGAAVDTLAAVLPSSSLLSSTSSSSSPLSSLSARDELPPTAAAAPKNVNSAAKAKAQLWTAAENFSAKQRAGRREGSGAASPKAPPPQPLPDGLAPARAVGGVSELFALLQVQARANSGGVFRGRLEALSPQEVSEASAAAAEPVSVSQPPDVGPLRPRAPRPVQTHANEPSEREGTAKRAAGLRRAALLMQELLDRPPPPRHNQTDGRMASSSWLQGWRKGSDRSSEAGSDQDGRLLSTSKLAKSARGKKGKKTAQDGSSGSGGEVEAHGTQAAETQAEVQPREGAKVQFFASAAQLAAADGGALPRWKLSLPKNLGAEVQSAL
jgi:hypothetical protein